MPGNSPPNYPIRIDSFALIQTLTWSTTLKAYLDASETAYYLYVEMRDARNPDLGQLYLDTSTAGGNHPKVEIPSATNDVLSGGTFADGFVTFEGNTYAFRVIQATGALEAERVIITP